jgi:8-amino-3,8-dideoxy-alpha-D-manno-octulosonate transaminase
MYLTNEDDVKAISEVILSKKYFRNRGKDFVGHCRQFELGFAKMMGVDHSLMVTSGTNALICALSALGLREEDEVILPAFTFFATAAAVINAKATPVIVNIDKNLTIDPEEVLKAITPRTKVIIAVHMDGHPCDMRSLRKIADEYKIILIEDVAQACGGSYGGKRLGSIGEMGCFSFNVDKILSCGEGGAFITNDEMFYQNALCVQDACCSFGPTFKDAFTKVKPFIGQSMRVSEISGALMNVQLARLEDILLSLRERKKVMMEILGADGVDIVASHDEAGDCGTSFYLRFSSGTQANIQLMKFAKDKIVAIPISLRPAHACWQWMHLLEKERPRGQYKKSGFLASMDLLTSTLKINVPFEMEMNEVADYAKKISQVIRG